MESKADTDPYLWLEDVLGPPALQFAKQQSDSTMNHFKSDARFKQIEKSVSEIVLAKDRVPFPSRVYRGQVFNFWQDEKNPKGIWRRTSLQDYKKVNPQWEIILDVDELSRVEKENWVFKAEHCLFPEAERCLIQLSRAGKDASVFREFDLKSKSFVKDGFYLPEDKNDVAWLDENHLLIGAGIGKDPWTDSGYARTLRLWTRGEPIEKSKLIYEADKKDNGVWMYISRAPEAQYNIIGKHLGFYEIEALWLDPTTGATTKLDLPIKSEIQGVIQGQLLLQLNQDWKSWKADSLISLDIAALLQNKIQGELLFDSQSGSFLQDVAVTRSHIYLLTMEKVMSQLYRLERQNNSWIRQPVNTTANMSMDLNWYSRHEDSLYYFVQGFTQPSQLQVFDGTKTEIIKTGPHRYNEANVVAEQMWATSADGTKIPYFIVHQKNWKLDSNNPTLMYGYGGFKVSQKPSYVGLSGKLWLEKGGVYVLTNIRGGGEFGSQWHESAMMANKQRSYDDFIAIAEDLIKRKITQPSRLGIRGGSNGGLLVGAVSMQRPDLFGAVICAVPLLDMLRYHKLLAGYSWVSEYGNPDIPVERDVILKYSPYQNVRAQKSYPKIFFYTSTADDRVHPGHARKMTAKMLDMGYPVYYFENMEGGHAAASDPVQQVKLFSFEYIYLMQQLMDH